MPLPVLCFLIAAGFFFLWRGRKKSAKIFFIISVCWFILISTPPLPYFLVQSFEKRYPPLTELPAADSTEQIDILVLAAGHADDESLPPNSQLSSAALARLTEGVRLYKQNPHSRLILSGPGGREGLTQADALRRTAIIMGADSSAIFLMNKAKNTSGEAEEYKTLYAGGNRLILVTSAVHMPRAMMIFRKKGFNPVAAPANHIIKHGSKKNPWGWLPGAGSISKMETAIHEWVGLVLTACGLS